MKHPIKAIIFTTVMLLIAGLASAQSLVVATGSNTGTYSRMAKEINELCSSEVVLTEKNTSGSVENMGLLVGNQVNAAFIQTDILFLQAQTDDRVGSVKTLLAMHPEEVHVVSLKESTKKVGGKFGIGGAPLDVSNIEKLAGYNVGAWGGSYVTAKVILLLTGIQFNLVEYADAATAKAELDAGNIEAIIAVGGQPLGFVNELGNKYKLVPISDTAAAKLKSVYRPARLNYSKMNALGIPTVATDALFVTREYKTARFTESLARLRQCVLSNLDELKEATGKHPKWQAVDGSNKGKWAYYELPTTVNAKRK